MNRVSLIGRLVKDPVIKKTKNDVDVASFTLAVNRPKIKDKNQEADFIYICVWRKLAEVVHKYCKKGMLVSIEGSIRTSNYEVDGKNHTMTNIDANNIEFLESKKETASIPETNVQDAYYEESAPNPLDDEVFADFGDSIEFSDDIAF